MKIKNFNQYLNEAHKSSLMQPSDEEIEKAEKILDEGVDPSWDKSLGYFYIDVSGKYSVYYTLWRFNPQNRYSITNFITNLSIDFMTAVQKAKKAAGRVPIIIDKFGTQAGMFQAAKAEIITFGKHRGKTLGDIFVEDPQYILWLAKENRNPDRTEKLQYYKDLYFETITKKNIEESKSQYIGKIGDKINIEAKIYDVKSEVSSYDNKLQYRCKLVDESGNKYMTFSIGRKVKKDDEVKMTAKVKDHKEMLGVKFTIIYYCKIIALYNLNDDIEKFNL
jgi:hypothetical protein